MGNATTDSPHVAPRPRSAADSPTSLLTTHSTRGVAAPFATHDGRPPTTPAQAMIGFAIVVAWLFVFLAGMTIDSNPLRQGMLGGGHESVLATLSSLGLILISYTATNAAILSILSGMA